MNAPTRPAFRGLARRLGWRPAVVVDGVRYQAAGPIDRETGLPRVLRVTFPAAGPLRIRPTPDRLFNDLTPDPRRDATRSLRSIIRPGGRSLIIGCGTGAAAAELADIAGDCGGVIAIDDDAESIRFAKRRYPRPNLGFERGSPERAADEAAPGFDTAVVDAASLTPGDTALLPVADALDTPADLFLYVAGKNATQALTPAIVRLMERRAIETRICWRGQTDRDDPDNDRVPAMLHLAIAEPPGRAKHGDDDRRP